MEEKGVYSQQAAGMGQTNVRVTLRLLCGGSSDWRQFALFIKILFALVITLTSCNDVCKV